MFFTQRKCYIIKCKTISTNLFLKTTSVFTQRSGFTQRKVVSFNINDYNATKSTGR